MEQLKDNRSRLFNASHQIPAHRAEELEFYDDKLEKLENILKETSKAVNEIMHVHEQLRKRFCPGSSENAEMKRQKRSAKENKHKLRNSKKKTLLKNARNLAVLLAGETFSNLFSPDEDGKELINEKITASHLTSLNHRMLTPRKHLNALKFLLEKEIFHKGPVDTVQSIISILQTRKSKGKICPKKRKRGLNESQDNSLYLTSWKGKQRNQREKKMRKTKIKRLVTTKMMPLKVNKK